MIKPIEVEFKYRAEDIQLDKFEAFAKERAPAKVLTASGYDYFYANEKDPGSFARLRSGADMHQLTFKRKTNDANNFVRTEHNIDLARKMTRDQVSALLLEFGYKPDLTIFKNCFVYSYDYYTLVYYVCYDTQMKELGRFIEIEMAEEYPWSNETEAWDSLTALERLCKPLGITPQARVKRSLFELFRPVTK